MRKECYNDYGTIWCASFDSGEEVCKNFWGFTSGAEAVEYFLESTGQRPTYIWLHRDSGWMGGAAYDVYLEEV